MNVPIKPSAIELGHLEQTLATAGWALIVRKIGETHQRVMANALKAASWQETLIERGKLEGLKLALEAPQILKEEITERLKREGK
jgi:hypothetical protein